MELAYSGGCAWRLGLFASLAFMTSSFYVLAEEIPLYPTGPDADSAFIRFVNSDSGDLVVASGRAKTVLNSLRPSTGYLSVVGGDRVNGKLSHQNAESVSLEIIPEAGEFVTVLVVLKNGKLSWSLLRETPDEFNALKASIGFSDMSAGGCDKAELKVDGRDVTLFKGVRPGTMARRLINTVPLKVQLYCADKSYGAVVDLGQLAAGERYSALVLPSGNGSRLLFINDQPVQ
jgi:alginate O-acetyltransferase complex protein AlgF